MYGIKPYGFFIIPSEKKCVLSSVLSSSIIEYHLWLNIIDT